MAKTIDLEESDMPDIRTLPKEQLELVPHEIKKWRCCIAECNGFTRIKDFGISPLFLCFRTKWINLENCVFYCSKHWKLYNVQIKRKTEFRPEEGFKLGPGIYHITDNV